MHGRDASPILLGPRGLQGAIAAVHDEAPTAEATESPQNLTLSTQVVLEEAAVLYGHLEAHHPPWGLAGVRRSRQRGLDRIRHLSECDLLMAHGADMDRDQLVAYTLDRLGSAVPAEAGPA